jgi:hypothetical protein
MAPHRVGPVLRDEPSVPAQQRVGLHEQDRPPVTSQDASERGEEHAVDRFELGSGHLTAQYAQLMPENEDLSIFGAVPSTTQYEVQHDADKTVKKTNHADDVGQLSQSPSDRAKRCAWKARTSFRHAQSRTKRPRKARGAWR